MKKSFITIALLLPLMALASTATTNLTTTASMNSTCSFSATPANFGEWIPNAPAIYSNGSSQKTSNQINVLCNNKLPFTIKGMPYIAKPGALGKYMTGATSTDDIVYTVYINETLNAGSWFGDGATNSGGKTYVINSAGTGANQSIPLYFYLYPSSVYPKKWVKPDNYSDNYTLTLTY